MKELVSIERGREELTRVGFTKLNGVLSPDHMRIAEPMLDALIERGRRSPEASWRAAFARTTSNEPAHHEVYRPALLTRGLWHSQVFVRCQQLATGLLGRPAHYLFDHAIYKQPWSDTGVHWHQDQAYLGTTLPIRSVHFWIPFQDVDADSGCLRFVPASHAGTLWHHRSAFDAHPHILRADIEEPGQVVEQPMMLGDISVHTNFTLHASGPNRTDRIRKAWIIHFGDRPRWYKHFLRTRARLASCWTSHMTSGAQPR